MTADRPAHDPEQWRDLPLVERSLLDARAEVVAPHLLGTLLVTEHVVARIVEVEAYGPDDPASHSVRGPSPRNATMFAGPGHLYCYLSYGIHRIANVVVGPPDHGAAVLVRAVDVVAGRAAAAALRGDPGRTDDRPTTTRWLGGGPGRLGQLLALDRDRDDGLDLLDRTSRLVLCTDATTVAPQDTSIGPRVGVTGAPDVPWRWWVADHPAVSRYVRSPRAAPPT